MTVRFLILPKIPGIGFGASLYFANQSGDLSPVRLKLEKSNFPAFAASSTSFLNVAAPEGPSIAVMFAGIKGGGLFKKSISSGLIFPALYAFIIVS